MQLQDVRGSAKAWMSWPDPLRMCFSTKKRLGRWLSPVGSWPSTGNHKCSKFHDRKVGPKPGRALYFILRIWLSLSHSCPVSIAVLCLLYSLILGPASSIMDFAQSWTQDQQSSVTMMLRTIAHSKHFLAQMPVIPKLRKPDLVCGKSITLYKVHIWCSVCHSPWVLPFLHSQKLVCYGQNICAPQNSYFEAWITYFTAYGGEDFGKQLWLVHGVFISETNVLIKRWRDQTCSPSKSEVITKWCPPENQE
jgi:hypothetical protein